jgi:hypothetical protein
VKSHAKLNRVQVCTSDGFVLRRTGGYNLCKITVQQSARCGRFPFEAGRVAPQIFQAVKRSFVPVKNVDNNLQIIEHNPLACGKPVNRHGSHGMVLSQMRLNFVCDCF